MISSVFATLKLLWRKHRLLLSAFLLALAVTIFFAVRMTVFWVYWSDPEHRNQPIQGWMTPRYIAHSWQVPPELVGSALGLEPGAGRITVDEIARERNVPVEAVIAEIMEAIRAHRDARP